MGSYCHIVVSILDFESNHLGSNPSNSLYTMPWPSGLRRQIKALVRKGAGSNPAGITRAIAQLVEHWIVI